MTTARPARCGVRELQAGEWIEVAGPMSYVPAMMRATAHPTRARVYDDRGRVWYDNHKPAREEECTP